MITDNGLILMGFMTTISMIILIQLNNRNWFKKFKFKNEMQFLKKQQDLQLKRLSKQLKIDQNTGNNTQKGGDLGGLSQFLPLLKNLDPDQIQDLIGILSGEGSAEPEGALADLLSKIPPDLIQGFLQGAKQKQQDNSTTPEIIYEE